MDRVVLTLTGGALADAGVTVPDWPWRIPPAVVWVTLDASGRWVVLRPDAELMNMVAARAAAGGLGWVPYRRSGAPPYRMRKATVWRYDWAAEQDPALRVTDA